MSILNKSIRWDILQVILLIVINLNCFCLVDQYKSIIGPLTFQDVIFATNILTVIFSCFKKNGKQEKISLLYVLPSACMYCISAINAHTNFNQSLADSFLAVRVPLSQICICPFLINWIKKNNLENFKKIIYYSGLFYLSICILQYFLYNSYVFTFVNSNSRYGENRLYFPVYWIILFSLILINIIFTKSWSRTNAIKYFIFLGAIMFTFSVITKGRMLTISFIAGIFICVLFINGDYFKKIISILLFCFLICLFSKTNMGHDLIALFTQHESTSDNSSYLRDYGRQYFLNKLTNTNIANFIFGFGVPRSNNSVGYAFIHPIYKNAVVYPEDNGVIGYAIYFGLFGFLIWLLFAIVILYFGFNYWFKNKEVGFLLVSMMDVLPCISLVPMFFYSPFTFSCLFALTCSGYSKELL